MTSFTTRYGICIFTFLYARIQDDSEHSFITSEPQIETFNLLSHDCYVNLMYKIIRSDNFLRFERRTFFREWEGVFGEWFF